MNSPANSTFVKFLKDRYESADKKDLKIFMSVGSDADNRRPVRAFKRVLEAKGYDLTYEQNDKGHTWGNWKPLLPDVLETFFAVDEEE